MAGRRSMSEPIGITRWHLRLLAIFFAALLCLTLLS
jgi:hypothetical protein